MISVIGYSTVGDTEPTFLNKPLPSTLLVTNKVKITTQIKLYLSNLTTLLISEGCFFPKKLLLQYFKSPKNLQRKPLLRREPAKRPRTVYSLINIELSLFLKSPRSNRHPQRKQTHHSSLPLSPIQINAASSDCIYRRSQRRPMKCEHQGKIYLYSCQSNSVLFISKHRDTAELTPIGREGWRRIRKQ